jgi:glycosyltransferase involved in cell wall biosynthesis
MRTSVIVPTYNASDRLARTIEAVLAQQYRPAEIIVIDDGSTDATAQTCRNFGNSIIYHRTDNGGQQAARNLGASIATGDWLSLLDHDDLWDPEYLAEVDRFITNHNIDVVWCNCRTLRETAQSSTVTVQDRFRQHAPANFWQTRGIAPDERWSVLQSGATSTSASEASILGYATTTPRTWNSSSARYEQRGSASSGSRSPPSQITPPAPGPTPTRPSSMSSRSWNSSCNTIA